MHAAGNDVKFRAEARKSLVNVHVKMTKKQRESFCNTLAMLIHTKAHL